MPSAIVNTGTDFLYNLVISLTILLLGLGTGMLVKKIVFKLLRELEVNKNVEKIGRVWDLEKSISFLVANLIYLVTIILFLMQLKILKWVIYLVLGIVALLLILTVLAVLKNILPNFFAGIRLHGRKWEIKISEIIKVQEIEGVVEKRGWLETILKTGEEEFLYIPNRLVLKSRIKL